jgi:hypothetical protein
MSDLRDAAQMALDIQSGVNVSGLVHAFSRVMTTVWAEAHRQGKGTDWVNRHPVVVLFADKIKSLAGDDFATAYEECERLSKGG